jgi:ABC-type nickel/cobalt efflux system permease component RcnA
MNIIFYGGLFALGALDAIQPGHAKSLVSSYLVGANARLQQLIILGLVVAITHIIINGVLAFGIVLFASSVLDTSYLRTINIISGVAIVLLALYLIWLRFFTESAPKPRCCSHHSAGMHNLEKGGMPLWQVITLGITGGLVPCPVVLTALISAISTGQASEAIFGMSIFSLGMGSVIIGVGLATLLGVKNIALFNNPENHLLLSRMSAIAVLLMGAMITTQALFFYEVEQEAPINLIMNAR